MKDRIRISVIFGIIASLLIVSCGKKGSDQPALTVDKQTGTITFLAEVNGKYLLTPTRHGVVFKDGKNGDKSIFIGLTDHKTFYDALIAIGARAGNNMTMENKETTKVEGDLLDVTVTWKGAPKSYTLDEVINDSNKKPILMRFGGNLEKAMSLNTGCLFCLDSCPVGIVSNCNYTFGAVEKRKEVAFTGNKDILPADKTLVTFTVKLKK
ncbi:MAG TPA: YdjY domain-containing protein [Spirochaetota bacterium]|nr:YdjY domain-containing protein [Spirochaetota bacterium]